MEKQFTKSIPATYKTYFLSSLRLTFTTPKGWFTILFDALISGVLSYTFEISTPGYGIYYFVILFGALILIHFLLRPLFKKMQAKKFKAQNIDFIVGKEKITVKVGDFQMSFSKESIKKIKLLNGYAKINFGGLMNQYIFTHLYKDDARKILKEYGYTNLIKN